MPAVPKPTLFQLNTDSFPNNNLGEITPADLRDFNSTMIASLVDEIPFGTYTASVDNSISAINTFTASGYPSYTALNSFSASQLTINTGVNTTTQSLNGSVTKLNQATASLQNFTSSINQIIVNGASIGTSTRFFFNGFVTASIIPNIDGAIASITILSDTSLQSTASFNQFTASTNTFTASAQTSINQLLTFSSSLDATYATDAQLNYSTSVLFLAIDTKLGTASFNAFSSSVATSFSSSTTTFNTFSASQSSINSGYNSYTSSNNTKWNTIGLLTGSFATTGSNSFLGNQTINGNTTITGSALITGSITITGSAYGNVISASIASSTASIDLSKGNFFTLALVNGAITNINVINPAAGATALIKITNTGIPSASFSSNVKQSQYNNYTPSTGSSTDLLSVAAFDSTNVYVTKATNFV
jgi:hypothetical protein